MSDDLTPAEQARAARWAAQALYERAPTSFQASRYALREIADHLDPPAPPETVKSLREQVDTEHAAWLSAENALHEANGSVESLRAELADTRTDLHKANAEIYRLRAAIPVAEAARGRCRKPQVFVVGDNRTDALNRVLDAEGDEWYRDGSVWKEPKYPHGVAWEWRELLEDFGPLIEVMP